jgi:hypothetical protein
MRMGVKMRRVVVNHKNTGREWAPWGKADDAGVTPNIPWADKQKMAAPHRQALEAVYTPDSWMTSERSRVRPGAKRNGLNVLELLPSQERFRCFP